MKPCEERKDLYSAARVFYKNPKLAFSRSDFSGQRYEKGPEVVGSTGPISFLGLTFRRYYVGYILKHFNLSHLKPVDMKK